MRSKHVEVADTLGRRVVNRQFSTDAVLYLADIENEFGVSRTVAREAMRLLQSLGMLDVHRRVGLRVTDQSKWKVLSPQIIGWRLEGPERDDQLRSLTDLRVAIEPTAGRLAATNASDEQRQLLLDLAARLQQMGGRGLGQTDKYLRTDVTFHQTLLLASGNEMLAALTEAVEAVMVGRTRIGMSPEYPVPEVLEHHEMVALAIQHRMPDAAEVCCRSLVTRVRREFVDGER